MKNFIVCVFICFFTQVAYSQLNGIYSPVGSTINAFKISIGDYSQPNCPFTEKPSINVNPSETFDLFLASNESQMSRAFGVDASIGGHYLFAKAKAELHKSIQQTSSSSETIICFSANLDYGTVSLNNRLMTDDAKALISSNPTKFVQTYGDYFISQERIVKKLFICLDVTCSSFDEINSVSGGCSGGVDMGAWSVGISMSARQVVNTAYKNHRCHIICNSLGLFDNNILASLPSDLEAEMRNKADFDLFASLQEHLIRLLRADQNMLNYFHEDPIYSDFTSLGLDGSYYTLFKRRLEKLEALNAPLSQLEQYQATINQYLGNMWQPFLPDDKTAQLLALHNSCGMFKDTLFDLINDCERQDCSQITKCCNLPNSLLIGINNLGSKLNEVLDVYVSGTPIGQRTFGIRRLIEQEPVAHINGLKRWSIEYKNPNPPRLDAKNYKVLNKNTPVSFIFSSNIYIQGYDPSKNLFNVEGKIYDFTTQREIPSHLIGTGLIYSNLGSNIKVSGIYTLDDPNTIYSADDIGFILNINEKSYEANIYKFVLPGYIGVNGQPDPSMQGLYCGLIYVPH